MSILRWHPLGQIWNEFDRVHNEMNRFLQYVDTGGPVNPDAELAAYPPLNVTDDNDNIYVEAELPGIALENLEITITDSNRLTLKGQRKPAELDKTTWHRQERCFGSFSRTLTLPVLVDSERIEARFELGDLSIKLPKSPKAAPHRIEVEQHRSGKQNQKKGKNHEHANR